MKKFSCLLVILIGFLISCSEDKEPVTVEVTSDVILFETVGGDYTLRITSNGDWGISGSPDWITFSAVSGIGNKEVIVTAKPNDTEILRQGEFIIRTSDNNQVVTITVRQLAGSITFKVNDPQERVFNGEGMSEDSVYIDSNLKWVLEGPSWLQAAWNGAQVPLDGKQVREGAGTLQLFCQANSSQDDRSGVLTIRSTVYEKTIEIPITQMGLCNVRPVNMTILANSFAFQWKYGAWVTHIFWQPFEGHASADEKTMEAALKYAGFCEVTPTIICSSKNRKANTLYEICAFGTNREGYYNQVCSTDITTPTDQNQPLATINSATLTDEGWSYTIALNNSASGYYKVNNSTSTFMNYADAVVALLMKMLIENNPDKCPLHKKGGTWTVYTTNDTQIVTWAVDLAGNFSNVITRKTCTQSEQQQASGNKVPAKLNNEQSIDLSEISWKELY